MDHDKTLTNMSPETRGYRYDYWLGRKNFRVTPEERDAVRTAARWESKTVVRFLRAAIAVRARDGFCKRDLEG